MNRAALAPGDQVLFQRGGQWRGQLLPRSGDASAPVRYGAYGDGPKPILLGSVERNDPEQWFHEGRIHLDDRHAHGPRRESTAHHGRRVWHLHTEEGAAASAGQAESASGWRVTCTQAGTRGNHIQFYTGPFRVVRGWVYRLEFCTRATAPMVLDMPALMQSASPWSRYYTGYTTERSVGTEWRTHVQFYHASVTADDARLTFFLGLTLPAGVTLFLDAVRLSACSGYQALPCDVGNVIFNGGPLCGVKVWDESDLDVPGEFWYDEERQLMKLCCEENPANKYADIQCALRAHIIDQSGASYVVYEDLGLHYGAAHGIGGGNTHHTVVRNCDVSYIGGGDQRGGEHTVRYGNGIEFWGTAHDHLVEGVPLVGDLRRGADEPEQRTQHAAVQHRLPEQYDLELRVFVRILEPAGGVGDARRVFREQHVRERGAWVGPRAASRSQRAAFVFLHQSGAGA